MKCYKRIIPLILACMMLAGCGQNVYKKGVESLENKDYAAAQENFRKAVEDKKNVADSYRGLGIAYYEQEKYKDALAAFENAVAAIAKGSVGDMVLYAKWSEKDMAVYKINNYEKGNVSVRKRTDTDDSSSVVIVAFYKTLNNNSVLIKTSIAEIGAIEKGDDISKTVEEPEDYSYAKVFMWNDLNGMMPRCNSPKMDK